MTQSIRIAYITNMTSTFTDMDHQLLAQRYQVQPLVLRNRHLSILAETWQVVKAADIVVAWFASWHSLPAFTMARGRNIPRVLITGGYDVANEPTINYGLRQGGLPYFISEAVFRLTSKALPFSATAYEETLKNTPLTAQNTTPLALGVYDPFADSGITPKEPIAMTIGNIEAMSVKRKGIRDFVEAAQYAPDVRFIVVGKHYDDTIQELQGIAGDNVEFTGFISDEALHDLLRRASVYVQASHHEGFGLAVAEAMLARCLPVVSRAGSLPEVVGKTGFYLEPVTPQHIAAQVLRAIDADPTMRITARQRVLDHFSIEQRRQGLYNAIESVLK